MWGFFLVSLNPPGRKAFGTNTVTSTTLLQIKERVVSAADYIKLVDFKKKVMADVNEKIVMKKG